MNSKDFYAFLIKNQRERAVVQGVTDMILTAKKYGFLLGGGCY